MGISLEELVTELLTGLSPRNLLSNLVESIASERDGHEVPRSGIRPPIVWPVSRVASLTGNHGRFRRKEESRDQLALDELHCDIRGGRDWKARSGGNDADGWRHRFCGAICHLSLLVY